MSKANSRFMDFIRAMGALLIVLIHAGNIFVNNADIMKAAHNPLAYIWWFFVSYAFGRQVLIMFFVLSGFLVGGMIIQRMRKGDAFFRRYLIDRGVRVYLVLIAVMAIGYLLDETGRRIFAGAGVYEIFPGHYNPWLLVASLFSLQGIWFVPFGTNEALWSLGVECWYYVVFPLIFMPCALAYSAGWRWFACFCGIVIFVALAWSGSYFWLGFVPWTAGAGVTLIRKPFIRSRLISLALMLIPLVVARLVIPGNQFDTYPTKIFTDCATAILTGNLLLTLRFDDSEGFILCRPKFLKTLADFSYSFYAIHVPILFFLWGVTEWAIRPHWRSEPATLSHYAMAIFGTLVAMASAFLLSLVTERKTDVVRRWAYRVLIPGQAPSRPQAAVAS
jgi:peptidoglycan/LPS O-acetylase OafA/YrhL